VRTQAFGDVVLVPGEDADGYADGDKAQAELHLAAKPDMIADDPVVSRVGAAFPNLTTEQERAGLDRHVPVCIDRAGNGDLVEEVKKVQMLIEHDGGAENSVGSRSLKFPEGVG